MKRLILAVAVFLAVAACKTNPFTGKSTLNFYPNSQIFPMAFAQYDEFLDENKVITGTSDAQMITRVGQRIASAAERWLDANGYPGYLKDYKWEYNLTQSLRVCSGQLFSFFEFSLPLQKRRLCAFNAIFINSLYFLEFILAGIICSVLALKLYLAL